MGNKLYLNFIFIRKAFAHFLVLSVTFFFFLVTNTVTAAANVGKPVTGHFGILHHVNNGLFKRVLQGAVGLPPSAPILSYTGVAANYPTGTIINPLSPSITGSSLTGNGSYADPPIVLGAGFNQPQGITLDAAGNIYVADFGNSEVKKIAADNGAITTVGSGFYLPEGVAVDNAGNVYVADSYNDAVKKVNASDGAITSLGTFSTPRDVAVDAAGNVFVADAGNSRIRKIAANSGVITTIGSGFLFPAGVAVDAAGNVYVADIGHTAVKKIPANGGTITTLCSGFSARYVTVDDAGNVYVADITNNLVKKIAATDGAITTVGSGFSDAIGIVVDDIGNVYVADGLNNVIKKVVANIYSISPALPAGLSMDPVTGIISGTPTEVTTTTTYTVTIQNALGSTTAMLTFSTEAALPVNWIALTGSLNKVNSAVFNWEVLEQNIAIFEVQKSADGHKFNSIGRLSSQGDGTHTYSFTDPQVYNSGNLYRIAEIAKDGHITYSKIIYITAANPGSIHISPNPAHSSIRLVVPVSLVNTNALLINMSGIVVKRVHLSGLSNKIPVQSLASGIYIVQFEDGNIKKIIKQ